MKVDQLINDQLVGKIVKYNWKDGENVVGEIVRIKAIEDHYGYFEMTLRLLDGEIHTYMLVPTRDITIIKQTTKRQKSDLVGKFDVKKLVNILSKTESTSLTLEEKHMIATYGMLFYPSIVGQDYINNEVTFKSLFCRVKAEMIEKELIENLDKAKIIPQSGKKVICKSVKHIGIFGGSTKDVDVTNRTFKILNMEIVPIDENKNMIFYYLHNSIGDMIYISELSFNVEKIEFKPMK